MKFISRRTSPSANRAAASVPAFNSSRTASSEITVTPNPVRSIDLIASGLFSSRIRPERSGRKPCSRKNRSV